MKRIVTVAIALLAASSLSFAKVELPAVIGDNMVIQQLTDAALWGKATPGKKVTVAPSWTKEKISVKADEKSGEWLLRVKTPVAGGPYTIKISDGETLTISNVLVGEVWFCSGQSNMEMPVKGYGAQPAFGGEDKIAFANPSRQIRICNVKKCSSTTVKQECECRWSLNDPLSVANTSATAYFFADYLQKSLGIPVGIIVTSWGGSSIETWLDRKTIDEKFAGEFNLNYLASGNVPPKQANKLPCLLYNGQVDPLVPYTFKGMIWYQGETNRNRPEQYIRLQQAYVEMMREKFNVPSAPFFFVQIAPYKYDNPEGFVSGFFCEAQQKSLSVIPNSGMATTVDCGELGTIHPCRKDIVGKRLALLALQDTYGVKGLEARAPICVKSEFNGNKAYVEFDVKNGMSPMGQKVSGFEIAGEDRVFHPATAILSNTRKGFDVWSPEVPNPVAVRYCFRNWGIGTIYNTCGIPAGPFRTDNWDEIK